jgi:uncharacterized DUF497 family protein
VSKPIRFSFHAEQRRKERGLNKPQIIAVIEQPEYFKKMPDGRKIAVKTVQNRTITVVYFEEEKFIRVITVY